MSTIHAAPDDKSVKAIGWLLKSDLDVDESFMNCHITLYEFSPLDGRLSPPGNS